MSKENLNKALINIAGSNVIGADNGDVTKLCKCISYLSTQLSIKANEAGTGTDAIFKNAAEMLNKKETVA